MSFRDHVTLATEFAVCDGLIHLAVTSSGARADAAIAALYELGYTEAAGHLDTALATSRELLAAAEPHSVKA